jgi:uncharacterized protein (DUF1697 family)
MDRRAALLRGINVGKAKRISMAELSKVFEKLGYRDVKTLLNSGNVAFTVPAGDGADPAPRIEEAIASKLGVSSRVTVITAKDLASALDECPLLDVAKNPSLLLVAVIATHADRAKLATLENEKWAPEALALGKRVAYLWCPGGTLKGRLWPAVERAGGGGVTSRTWSTMLKLRALVESA